jgi:phage terminase small subunit
LTARRVADATYSAEKAGYGGSAVEVGSKLMAKDGIRAQVQAHFDDLILTELMPAAYKAILRIFNNEHAPAGAVVAGFKLVNDHVFKPGDASLAKDPSEMTLDEIIRRSEELQRERANRAVDITPDPEPASVFD